MSKYNYGVSLSPKDLEGITCFMDIMDDKPYSFLTQAPLVLTSNVKMAILGILSVDELKEYLDKTVKEAELPPLAPDDNLLSDGGETYRPEVVENIELYVALNWALWDIVGDEVVASALAPDKQKLYKLVQSAWVKLQKAQTPNIAKNQAYARLHFRMTD